MEVSTVRDFGKTIFFKKLIERFSGKKVCALFTTYNNIRNFESGTVDSGKKFLSIIVENGDMPMSFDIPTGPMLGLRFSSDSVALSIMDRYSKKIFSEGKKAQTRVVAKVSKEIEKEENLLIIAYVGVSGFDPAINFISHMRKKHPMAIIIVVSCDCNTPKHFSRYKEDIDCLIFTSECGGRDSMAEVLQTFKNSWLD